MNYTANDIVSLSAGRAFREKIGMYLSADRQEAINLGLRELIVNVQDENEEYKPKNPYMKICLNTKERIISVEDNMRGIPVGIREDGINSLTATFLIPHSGGKHQEGRGHGERFPASRSQVQRGSGSRRSRSGRCSGHRAGEPHHRQGWCGPHLQHRPV